MDQYRAIVDNVISSLENYDQKREETIRLVRKLNRASGRGISKIVREEEYEGYLTESRAIISELLPLINEISPITSWGITTSGTEEYVEFELLHAIISKNELPGPEALQIPPWIWISGLGDVIGELRRYMLAMLIKNDMTTSKEILTLIQDLYDTIVGLEFSKSMVPNLRRKIDVARGLVDRCESDYANAVVHKQSKS